MNICGTNTALRAITARFIDKPLLKVFEIIGNLLYFGLVHSLVVYGILVKKAMLGLAAVMVRKKEAKKAETSRWWNSQDAFDGQTKLLVLIAWNSIGLSNEIRGLS